MPIGGVGETGWKKMCGRRDFVSEGLNQELFFQFYYLIIENLKKCFSDQIHSLNKMKRNCVKILLIGCDSFFYLMCSFCLYQNINVTDQ